MATSNFSSAEKWLVKKIQRSIGHAPVQMVLGRDDEIPLPGGAPKPRVIIRDRKALLRMLLDP
ncbi:MAG: hypothetical protein WCB14_06730, partial [Candidatus Acidiferrales bacterium]